VLIHQYYVTTSLEEMCYYFLQTQTPHETTVKQVFSNMLTIQLYNSLKGAKTKWKNNSTPIFTLKRTEKWLKKLLLSTLVLPPKRVAIGNHWLTTGHVRSAAHHVIYLQFDISANSFEIRAIQYLKSIVWCAVDYTYVLVLITSEGWMNDV
jgi:hypothetical protein